jgi:hypothetical protein
MQVLLVDTPDGTPGGTKRCTRPLTGVAVHFASAITVIIPRPFMDTMADRRLGWMTAPIALPFVGVQPRAASRHGFGEEGPARPRVRGVVHPEALLSRVARNNADDGGPIGGISAVAFALMGASTWRVPGIAMGRAFFPPRSGTVRRPQTPCRSSHRRVRCCSGASARAGAPCAVACVTSPTRGLRVRWVRLWQGRAAGVPAWLGVGGSFQRRDWSGAYRSRHRRGGGRPGRRPAAGRVGARGYGREGMPPHPGMQVTRQPDEANASVQQVGNRAIDPIGMIPHHAR